MRITIAACIIVLLFAVGFGNLGAQELTPMEELGRNLFLDTNLSDPPGQSCATCHGPDVGYTGPDEDINKVGAVYEGAFPGRFGNRKPPAAAYAGDSPILHVAKKGWVGGMFWDGRATGERLGDPLAEQAQGPFLNPLEQNLPSKGEVVSIVCASTSSYYELFEDVCGPCDGIDIDQAYDCIGRSIAAYERSSEVTQFTSKYDYALKGMAKLTQEESKGFALFKGKGKCAKCHVVNRPKSLFTDFTYDNLGIPKNPLNPFYTQPPEFNPDGINWVDYGLGGFLQSAGYDAAVYGPEIGKHKVPTLRNVDLRPYEGFVKAYGHNGFFKSLKEIVHFYNTRDVEAWPEPEVLDNINTTELGNLGLTDEEEDAIVAFLKTLSDGYLP
jgi:cytochrome c peroxidase